MQNWRNATFHFAFLLIVSVWYNGVCIGSPSFRLMPYDSSGKGEFRLRISWWAIRVITLGKPADPINCLSQGGGGYPLVYNLILVWIPLFTLLMTTQHALCMINYKKYIKCLGHFKMFLLIRNCAFVIVTCIRHYSWYFCWLCQNTRIIWRSLSE